MTTATLQQQTSRPTKWHYRLSTPVVQHYLAVLDDSLRTRTVTDVVVSLGRDGDSAIFPADSDGRIVDFDALHTAPTWIAGPVSDFVQEWLDKPELSQDEMPDGSRRYDHCDRCNYDRHYCPGCGTSLSHNGLERVSGDVWRKHEGCTE